MIEKIILLIVSLVMILVSCEVFTNGIEWLGKKLKLGHGVVGSLFSAVGTCLPETLIPIIAIFFTEKNSSKSDIGIGAIIGAPFMLSTFAFFVTGFSVLIFYRKRRSGLDMFVDTKILSRDIIFFIVVYSIGVGAAFVNDPDTKVLIAILLVVYYLVYVYLTVKHDKQVDEQIDTLYFVKIFGRFFNAKADMVFILIQISAGLIGIVLGAGMFVEITDQISRLLKLPALILSIIITPIATELPEKFNSIIWISKKKDTLALGNLSGAMVFQGCIPVSIGILATPWKLSELTIACAVLAICSALNTFVWIKLRGRLSPTPLLLGGVFYLVFIICFLR